MKRGVAALLAAFVTVLCVGAGVGTWLLVRPPGPQRPEITAYSHGHLTRVGPYLYCNVLNLNDCQTPHAQGELPFNEHYPVQLSVPEAISRAPWRLLQVYEDPTNTTATMFRPGTRLAPRAVRGVGTRAPSTGAEAFEPLTFAGTRLPTKPGAKL